MSDADQNQPITDIDEPKDVHLPVSYAAGQLVESRILGLESARQDIVDNTLPSRAGNHIEILLLRDAVASAALRGRLQAGTNPGEQHQVQMTDTDFVRRSFAISTLRMDPGTAINLADNIKNLILTQFPELASSFNH